MLIVAGHLTVDPADRDRFVADCRTAVVERARAAAGCLDFALSADALEPGRINVFERWSSEEELLAFRGSGPDGDTGARILDATVRRYTISGEGLA